MNTVFTPFKIYVAASYRHLHAVHLLYGLVREKLCPRVEFLDWTAKATPPPGLSVQKRRLWMDTNHGGEVFSFCRDACGSADLVIYYGDSGQDVGVEIGMANTSGVEVIGLAGPLESPGLMLHGAVDVWATSVEHLLVLIYERIKFVGTDSEGKRCQQCTMFGCEHDERTYGGML